jgi:hypothetical protein
MISKTISWLTFWKWKIIGTVEAADEIPSYIPKKRAILVGSKKHPKWLVFDCACGTGHRIMLNLDVGRRPTWRILKTDPLSLLPSVDFRNNQMRCHYFVRGGKIEWIHHD